MLYILYCLWLLQFAVTVLLFVEFTLWLCGYGPMFMWWTADAANWSVNGGPLWGVMQ